MSHYNRLTRLPLDVGGTPGAQADKLQCVADQHFAALHGHAVSTDTDIPDPSMTAAGNEVPGSPVSLDGHEVGSEHHSAPRLWLANPGGNHRRAVVATTNMIDFEPEPPRYHDTRYNTGLPCGSVVRHSHKMAAPSLMDRIHLHRSTCSYPLIPLHPPSWPARGKERRGGVK